MSRSVFCLKLQKEAEAMSRPPFPGPLGEKIYENISLEAWKMWQGQQTILINEHRLNMALASDREILREAMIKFLFE